MPKVSGVDFEHERQTSHELDSIIARAPVLENLTEDELALVRCNFTSHPLFALVYFHCCSGHPVAHVHNNETLSGAGAATTVKRLEGVLDGPVNAVDIQRRQELVSKSSGSAGNLWACASCCEMLNAAEDTVELVSVYELHQSFKLTAVEKAELGTSRHRRRAY